MQRWQIGDVGITRVIETEDTSMGPAAMLPEARPENVLPISWLRPHFIDEKGNLISSIYSLLVLSQGKRIVIDTCLGNDKPRIVPMWNKRQGAFLANIAEAGFPRESVDFVVCTHLHPDHVGWNTMLVDDRWVPTFPNARYIFSARDWEWLDKAPVTALGDYAGDSVRPVIEAGLAELVDAGFQIHRRGVAGVHTRPFAWTRQRAYRLRGPARGGDGRPDAPPLPARAAALVQPL